MNHTLSLTGAEAGTGCLQQIGIAVLAPVFQAGLAAEPHFRLVFSEPDNVFVYFPGKVPAAFQGADF